MLVELAGGGVDAVTVGARTRRGKVRAAVEMARGVVASSEVSRGGQSGHQQILCTSARATMLLQ